MREEVTGELIGGDLLVDGHVHFHDCFEVGAFLDAATDNFRSAAWDLGLEPAIDGCLLLAECSGAHFFERLQAEGVPSGGTGWRIRSTGESTSLFAESDEGARLLLVAGRQIVTREGVEVLALGAGRDFEDGLELRATLTDIEDASAIPVIPWGFGKWLFRRGEIVATVLSEQPCRTLFLGDNGGRPEFTPIPGLFRASAERGIRVLPGSDPLPVPWQERHVARYGFVMEDVSASGAPARTLIRAIVDSDLQPRFFGSREWIGGFLRSQIALQWSRSGGEAHARQGSFHV